MSTPETEHPKRLSLSRALELALTKSSGPGSSSITVGLTPKGEVVFEVVGRLSDGQTLEALELEVAQTFGRLAARYPRDDAAETRASVELTRNAKGETQIEVGLAGPDLETVRTAVAKAYDSARSAYPLASGLVGADPKADAR